MTAAQILRTAAELITPTTWTQGVSARDAGGAICMSRDSRAARWCAEGALLKASGNIDADFCEAVTALHAVCDDSFVKFNDARGRQAEEVRAAMMRAARRLERRAS